MASSLRVSAIFALFILLLASLLSQQAAAQNGGDSSGDGPVPDLKATGLILVKVYCLIIIFFATFLPGVSPYFLRWNATFLVLGIQFAAGVFLATAMLHFLADANGTFADLTTKTYPFAFMLAVSGYFLTMLADLIIQYVYSRQPVGNSVGNRPPFDVEANNVKAGAVQPEGDLNNHRAGRMGISSEVPEVQHTTVKATLIHKVSLGDAMLLMLALCFHSVFEGIAIGVSCEFYLFHPPQTEALVQV
ncbi:unnamed protein product [Calypogeia fissa]